MNDPNKNIKSSVSEWIESCLFSLQELLVTSGEEYLLLDAFVGQYQLAFNRIVDSKSWYFDSAKYLLGKILKANKTSILSLEPIDSFEIDILFWPWLESNFKQIRAVYDRLFYEGDLKIALGTHNQRTYKTLKEEGIKNLVRLKIDNQISSYRCLRAKHAKNKRTLLKLAKRMPLYNAGTKKVSFVSVLKESWTLEEQYLTSLMVFDRIKARSKFEILFVDNDITIPGRTMVSLAKSYNIKTCSIMHGSLKSSVWKFLKVDTFFVFGNEFKQRLRNLGVQRTKLVVSGSPYMESMIKNVVESPEKSIICVAFSGPGNSINLNHHIAIIDLINQVIRQFPKQSFVIKLHEKDRIEYYNALLENNNVLVKSYDEISLFEILGESAALITTASTSAYEAMLLDVPVLTMDLLQVLQSVDFIKAGATFNCIDKSTLIRALSDIIQNQPIVQDKNKIARKISENSYYFPLNGTGQLIIQELKNMNVDCDFREKN